MQTQPYRILAPRPNDPEAPEADAYEIALRRRSVRTRRLVTALCAFLGSVSLLAYAESPPSGAKKRRETETAESRAGARVAESRSVVANARAEAMHAQELFLANMLKAIDEGVSTAGDEPCPLAFPEATHLIHGSQAFPLLVVRTGDRDLPSPSIANVLTDIHRAQEHFDRGRTLDGILYANALLVKGPSTRLRYDVVLVATSMKHPSRTNDSAFEPGEVRGRAYVYDFVEKRVTCAGDVEARSSTQVEYSYIPAHVIGPTDPHPLDQRKSLSASLDDDLEIQVQRAIKYAPLYRVVAAH